MLWVILPLILQPPPQTGLVIEHDFISRRECRRRQQIHFFQSLQFFVLYLRTRRLVVHHRGRTWVFTRPQNWFQRTLNDRILDHWWKERAMLVELEIQWRVRFDLTINTARKQHVISSVWYISPSHDWLSRFGFLLTHTSYLGNCHGEFFNSF